MKRSPFLSVVVPTFNEPENLEALVSGLRACLAGIQRDFIFVDDDSPNGTALAVRELAAKDCRVRHVHRLRRHGLSSACIEGMLASVAPFVAVMDADLQHDERLLPRMLAVLQEGYLDIVVGSRSVEHGSMGE